MIPAEVRKAKLVPKKQPQISIAEPSEALNAYTAHVDGGPRWRLFPLLKQSRRRMGLPRKYSAEKILPDFSNLKTNCGRWASRFVWAATFLKTLPEPIDYRAAIAGVMNVIRTTMAPFGAKSTPKAGL